MKSLWFLVFRYFCNARFLILIIYFIISVSHGEGFLEILDVTKGACVSNKFKIVLLRKLNLSSISAIYKMLLIFEFCKSL